MKELLEQWQVGMTQLAEAARVMEGVGLQLKQWSKAAQESGEKEDTAAAPEPEPGKAGSESGLKASTAGSGATLEGGGGTESTAVAKITAAVEEGGEASKRGLSLERRLAEAEQMLARLEAKGSARELAPAASERARKTLPTATVQLLAKQGLEAGEAVDVGSLDAALVGMSIEHRIAVKSQMLRAGTLTS